MTDTPRITGHVFIATSLDGFIARDDDGLDWLMKQPVEDEDHGYDAFIARMDGVVMGRRSFERVRDLPDWPYDKPVVVVSQSLDPALLPDSLAERVRITRATPLRLMEALQEEGWSTVYVDGGKLIQSFLRAGLIHEMTITRAPVLLGGGVPLFGLLEEDVDFDLIETRAFRSGLVSTTYRLRE
ncbi:dihydrofolate reductase family protein [Thetidibacter halocola]|uniref:Dihydrofolate reductase n=1 Tax=Thetidibacter halocola TaxID=2827239 RepID=A0A8J8B9Y0_9RHOB|nr:dihydrofolate reductase family protein [Thetidibacter halocola]MBS0126000.1 dihydrofolate reductase [Thetidibacter halocola]